MAIVRERQIPHDFTHMWNLQNKVNEQTKGKQVHRYREQTDGCQVGDGWLEGRMKKVKGLRSTDWQLPNSREDTQHREQRQ